MKSDFKLFFIQCLLYAVKKKTMYIVCLCVMKKGRFCRFEDVLCMSFAAFEISESSIVVIIFTTVLSSIIIMG